MKKKSLLPTQQITLFSILLSIGLVFHYLESFFCIPIATFPLKIGLSNMVILFYVVQNRYKEALLIGICKVMLSLFFSPTVNFSNFLISLGGFVVSFLGMLIANLGTKQKTIPVSITGGILHNIGQLIVVLYLLRMTISLQGILFFLSGLITLGSISGFFVGMATQLILSKLSNIPTKSDYNNR